MTKKEMATTIIWQIKGTLEEPSDDHPMAAHMVKYWSKPMMVRQYHYAQRILKERGLGYYD